MKKPLLLLVCLLFAGCAAKGTSVVLIEDPGGKVGQVTVNNSAGERTLSSARQETNVAGPAASPTPARTVSQDEIDKTYGQVLRALPEPVETFILYFDTGTTVLARQSMGMPDEILAAIARRSSRDVRVNGHSDRVGAFEDNYRLSLQRARAVRDMLVQKGADPAIISVFSHGEGNPLIPTPDDVPEPRNRRVEVLVR